MLGLPDNVHVLDEISLEDASDLVQNSFLCFILHSYTSCSIPILHVSFSLFSCVHFMRMLVYAHGMKGNLINCI